MAPTWLFRMHADQINICRAWRQAGLAWALSALFTVAAAPASAQQVVTVGQNEFLGTIARQVRPSSATLNQTLVALYEANPKAFIQNNLNLVYAGARLTLPSEAAVLSKSPAQATQVVADHNARFAAWRQRLAARANAATPPAQANQGNVTAQASQAQPPQGDRLELSQAQAEERQIAQAEAARQQALQAEAMTRNLLDLNKIQNQLAQMPAVAAPPVAAQAEPIAKPDPYAQWPAWMREVKDHPALIPAVVVVLLLLALWAWVHGRREAQARQMVMAGSALGPWVDGIDLDLDRDPKDPTEPNPGSLSSAVADADVDDAIPHYLSGSADGDLQAADALASAGNADRARELAEQALADPSADVRARARALLDRIAKG